MHVYIQGKILIMQVQVYTVYTVYTCIYDRNFTFLTVYKDEGFGYLSIVRDLAAKSMADVRREIRGTPNYI